jgi:hypothetical protein
MQSSLPGCVPRAVPAAAQRAQRCAARRCSSRAWVAACAFVSDNPQNVPAVERGPTPELTPVEAVRCVGRGARVGARRRELKFVTAQRRIQLKAASCNDTPRTDHGVHTLYEFAADAGDMERSKYFGTLRCCSWARAPGPLTVQLLRRVAHRHAHRTGRHIQGSIPFRPLPFHQGDVSCAVPSPECVPAASRAQRTHVH